jgi:carbon monoxide dehydrogenase subunit G
MSAQFAQRRFGAFRLGAFHLLAAITSMAMFFSQVAHAHGPTRQKVVERITINAPPEKVWARIKNFDALKDWHPAVSASPASQGNTEGSVREIKLKDGGAITETLEGYDDAKMKYNYRGKDGGALPVTNYTSTLAVMSEGGVTVVEWRGAFYRAYPQNDPPPDKNDDAAIAAVTAVYKGGLANLKKLAEGS